MGIAFPLIFEARHLLTLLIFSGLVQRLTKREKSSNTDSVSLTCPLKVKRSKNVPAGMMSTLNPDSEVSNISNERDDLLNDG